MKKNFRQLSYSKQQQIINVVLEEFGKYGYQHASTNRMVKQAQISKGSLFNYFGSKQEMYLSALQYCIDVLVKNMPSVPMEETVDLLLFLEKTSLAKLKTLQQNPSIFAFLLSAQRETQTKLQAEIFHRISTAQNTFLFDLYQHFDRSLFKTDLDVEKAYQTIFHTFENLGHKYQEQNDLDMEKAKQETLSFLSFFRAIFYQ